MFLVCKKVSRLSIYYCSAGCYAAIRYVLLSIEWKEEEEEEELGTIRNWSEEEKSYTMSMQLPEENHITEAAAAKKNLSYIIIIFL